MALGEKTPPGSSLAGRQNFHNLPYYSPPVPLTLVPPHTNSVRPVIQPLSGEGNKSNARAASAFYCMLGMLVVATVTNLQSVPTRASFPLTAVGLR